MVQTINNPDGTVSIIQVDPSAVVAIQDGSGQTQVRTLSSLRVRHYSTLFHMIINLIISSTLEFGYTISRNWKRCKSRSTNIG